MKIKKNKICRREGENFEFFSEKRFFSKTRSLLTPGEHGTDKGKVSDYGMLLRIKQKIKRYYILSEKTFKLIYKKISKNFFFCEDLVNFLERRLDNIIYRMNFTLSRKNSRQKILHGFVYVNYKKIKFSSFIIDSGDSIYIENFLNLKHLYDCKNFFNLNWIFTNYFNGFGILLFLPNYFKFNFNKNIILDIYK
ncbi:MAG: 30S ribosomal protein S4 [Candidatus Carsonella ruddii]|nr:MAG: 30S ribosomal protein S4 [Candidatus Carsonella ruddii]WMC19421.1 MAG: 30S ribosomal protein S4 [Candidatus Carsonella ruddii]